MFLSDRSTYSALAIVSRTPQRGSALVIAIFVIIVMTLLGVGLVNMLSSTSESIAYEVLGTRTYHAGQTGLQWQLQRTFPIAGTGSCNNGDETQQLAGVSGLSQCQFTVNCTSTNVNGVTHYNITSVGQCDDLSGSVITTRQFEVNAKDLEN